MLYGEWLSPVVHIGSMKAKATLPFLALFASMVELAKICMCVRTARVPFPREMCHVAARRLAAAIHRTLVRLAAAALVGYITRTAYPQRIAAADTRCARVHACMYVRLTSKSNTGTMLSAYPFSWPQAVQRTIAPPGQTELACLPTFLNQAVLPRLPASTSEPWPGSATGP